MVRAAERGGTFRPQRATYKAIKEQLTRESSRGLTHPGSPSPGEAVDVEVVCSAFAAIYPSDYGRAGVRKPPENGPRGGVLGKGRPHALLLAGIFPFLHGG